MKAKRHIEDKLRDLVAEFVAGLGASFRRELLRGFGARSGTAAEAITPRVPRHEARWTLLSGCVALPHLQAVALPQAASRAARDRTHHASRDRGLEQQVSARVSTYPCLEHLANVRTRSCGHWVSSYPGVTHQVFASIRTPARRLLYLSAMSKSKRSKRSRGTVDRSATTDVVTQLECAIRNPHAALIGALIGGLVPWFGRTLAHDQVPAAWSTGNTPLVAVMLAVVLGCALFSALSVYKFGKAAFGDSKKALGFVLALEGVMLVTTGATSTVALAVLILINAVANGSVIALSRDATRHRCEADARRAATRMRSRAGRTEQSDAPAATTTEQPRVRAPRPAQTPSRALVTPVWRRATLNDDVIDAEIVSEESLPS